MARVCAGTRLRYISGGGKIYIYYQVVGRYIYSLSGGGTKPSNIGGGGGEDFPEGGKAAGQVQMIGQHLSVECHEFRSCPSKCFST